MRRETARETSTPLPDPGRRGETADRGSTTRRYTTGSYSVEMHGREQRAVPLEQEDSDA